MKREIDGPGVPEIVPVIRERRVDCDKDKRCLLSAYVSWGFNLNASASTSKPVNISKVPESPNPQLDIVVSINSGWWFQNWTGSVKYRATSEAGIRMK